MEQLEISWGVQYELARGVLAEKWKWEDITGDVLRQLRGTNAQAASRVTAVMSMAIGRTNTVSSTESGTTNPELW
jgi:RNA-dependent RNA polymerase